MDTLAAVLLLAFGLIVLMQRTSADDQSLLQANDPKYEKYLRVGREARNEGFVSELFVGQEKDGEKHFRVGREADHDTVKSLRVGRDVDPSHKQLRVGRDTAPAAKRVRVGRDTEPLGKLVRVGRDTMPVAKRVRVGRDAKPSGKRVRVGRDTNSAKPVRVG